MQRIRTIQNLALYTALPVVVLELMLLPFWSGDPQFVFAPTAQLFITGIILPLYLTVTGIVFVTNSDLKRSILALLILGFSALLAGFLYYFAWGISTGLFWTPDQETLDISVGTGEIALVISLSPSMLVLLFRCTSLIRRGGT